MLWIFADDKYDAFAPDNSAFGATLPYRWRNFHDNTPYKLSFILYIAKFLIIHVRLYFVQITRNETQGSWDSQDERFSFGDSD